MRKTIYIFGNEILADDSLPLSLLPILRKKFPEATFSLKDPTEDIPDSPGQTLYLIDTIYGITSVQTFSSLADFQTPPRFTPHDYDVLLDLSLKKKLGKLKDFVIIGVPQKGDGKKLKKELIRIVSNLLSKNGTRNSYKDHKL